jgi:hypothetical protein
VSLNGGLWIANGNNTDPTAGTVGNLTGLIFPNLNIAFTNFSALDGTSLLASGLSVANIFSIRTIWLPSLYNFTGDPLFSGLPKLTNLSTFNSLYSHKDILGTVGALNNFEISYTNVSPTSIQAFFMISMRFVGN